jgi:hypothetical protein
MNVFDVWLIIVGLAIGAGLAWLVMLDLRRRDDDIAASESRAEAGWIADTLRSREIAADAEAVEEVLRLHRAYLAGIPDDGALRPARAPAFVEPYDDEVDGGPFAAAAPTLPRAAGRPATVAPPTATTPLAPGPVDTVEAEVEGDALEPAWADEDLAAAHEALDVLLKPPED